MSIGKIKILSTSIYFPSSVDFDKYPSLNDNIHYYQVNLSKGDCLFIPALWIHQVRSNNRNIAVNYWLNHERVKNAIVDKSSCSLINKSNFMTLATIQWPKESSNLDDLKRFMLDLVDADVTNFKEWTREFSRVKSKSLFGELKF
jgi:hypothetical protein